MFPFPFPTAKLSMSLHVHSLRFPLIPVRFFYKHQRQNTNIINCSVLSSIIHHPSSIIHHDESFCTWQPCPAAGVLLSSSIKWTNGMVALISMDSLSCHFWSQSTDWTVQRAIPNNADINAEVRPYHHGQYAAWTTTLSIYSVIVKPSANVLESQSKILSSLVASNSSKHVAAVPSKWCGG